MGKEENEVQNAVMKYVNGINGICQLRIDFPPVKDSIAFRINSKGIRGRKSTLPLGFPDILSMITIDGRAVPFFIEIKAPDKKCTNKDQLLFITNMEQRGAWATWTNSIEMLKEYIRGKISSMFAKDAAPEEQTMYTTFLARQRLIESYTEN